MNEALIGIVLKNLGIDKEALKTKIDEAFISVKVTAQRIENIEKKLIAISEKMEIAP